MIELRLSGGLPEKKNNDASDKTKMNLSSREKTRFKTNNNQIAAGSMKQTTVTILSICSVICLATNSISCLKQSNVSDKRQATTESQAATAANYNQKPHSAALKPADWRLADLSEAASTSPTNGGYYSPPLSQPPSVYHSIIDGTSASTSTGSAAATHAAGSPLVAGGDLNTAAGHHHGRHAHSKYYEYRAVPKKNTWKFGYKRGNHKHTISRHEHGQAGKHPHFKTKVKWHDKKSKGKGIHLWDYNHHDKKHYGHHHHG